MNLSIETFDSRNAIYFDTDEPFKKQMIDYGEEYFFFKKQFLMYNEKEVLVAALEVELINERRCYQSGSDPVLIADAFSGELYEAIEALCYDNKYRRLRKPALLCYISTLWVVPEFRNQGVATFILNNLPAILEAYTLMPIHAVTTFPKPLEISVHKGMCERKEFKNNNEEMLTKMIEVLEKTGFEKVEKSMHYLKFYDV